MTRWQERFDNEFIKKPGEHLLIIGITGSGKTQVLIYVITRIMYLADDETIVWFDMGKGTESFCIPELTKKRTRIILPEDCEIRNLEINVDFEYFEKISDIWELIDRNSYNIVSINPFIIDPVVYSQTIDLIFRDLIKRAHHYFFNETKMIKKLTLAFDEFHNIAPAQGHSLLPEQNRIGATIQMNIEKLRSFGIRFVATTQGETKIRKGVRSAFNWRIYRRISDRLIDIKRLENYEGKIQQLKINEALFLFPEKHFEIISFPKIFKYPSWKKNIEYRGVYEGEKDEIRGIRLKAVMEQRNNLIYQDYLAGLSVSEIAKKANMPEITVYKIIEKFKEKQSKVSL